MQVECRLCKQTVDLTLLAKDSSTKNGYKKICLPCHNASQRKRYQAKRDQRLAQNKQYREANKELIRERKRIYRERYAEEISAKKKRDYEAQREQKIAYSRAYYHSNKKEISKRAREYRQKNKAILESKKREYHLSHPEQARERNHRRRARMAEAGVFKITAKELRRLHSSPCYICGGKAEHIDHIVPLKRGGRHSIGNLAACCAVDNQRKNASLLIEYRAKVGLL